jgi:hypothetical protein
MHFFGSDGSDEGVAAGPVFTQGFSAPVAADMLLRLGGVKLSCIAAGEALLKAPVGSAGSFGYVKGV